MSTTTTTTTTTTAAGFPDPPDSAADLAAWRTADLVDYVGGFSNPSKMPGYAYGIPAEDCKVGGRLRTVAGSTCESCYAHERGAYAWRTVKAAYRRRADRLTVPYWAEAIAEVLNRRRDRRNGDVFRWHDSGDLQSVDHLTAIVRVAELTPDVRHWIPTREYRIVADYLAEHGGFPPNLTVRLSAHMIGGTVPEFRGFNGAVTISTVQREDSPDAFNCPARFQGNSCGDCRACWDPETFHVAYHLH